MNNIKERVAERCRQDLLEGIIYSKKEIVDVTLEEIRKSIEVLDLLEILKKCSDPIPHYKKGKIKAKRLDSDVSKIKGDITIYDSLFRKELLKQLSDDL